MGITTLVQKSFVSVYSPHMKYSKGLTPTTTVDPKIIMRANDSSRSLFDGDSGIYRYKSMYYLIGENIFLEYADLALAKDDWFGKSEEAMWETIKREGECIDSSILEGKSLYVEYLFQGLYYRLEY